MPVTAVSGVATLGVPVMVGFGAVCRTPPVTGAVGADSFVTEVKPVLAPVTLTVTTLPTSPATGVYVVPVAPATSAPSTVHW